MRDGTLSVEEIRSHFPALARKHNGFPVAHFDGPGGTQVPRVVADAVSNCLLHHNANAHGVFPASLEVQQTIEEARAASADFFNCSRSEIVFGNNMTSLAFHLASALAREFRAGDEIVVTELDHEANVSPWERLGRERRVVLRKVPIMRETGQLNMMELRKCIGPRTRLVAVTAASNALGTIVDLPPIIAAAKSRGAYVCVDAVHYAAHDLVDVAAWGCDFALCSVYKFYGPHTGLMYCRRELLERLEFPRLLVGSNAAPGRAEPGTQNHEGIAGILAALNFLASLSSGGSRRERLAATFESLHERSLDFIDTLRNGLSSIPGVTVFGPDPSQRRTPTMSFLVNGKPAREVSTALAERGIFVSNGTFNAAGTCRALNIPPEGLIRAGCVCYTTAEEVERLVEGVRAVVK